MTKQKSWLDFQAELEKTQTTPPHESLSLKVESLQVELNLALRFFDKIVFSSSLGIEDQVLTDFIFKHNLPIGIFTLDTGRLFNETYEVLDATTRKYGKSIQLYSPQHTSVETYVQTHGINAFKDSVELRKKCCAIRKLEPLKRALTGADLWLTGIRHAQSLERGAQPIVSWDEGHQVAKFNPLFHWSDTEIHAYIKTHDVPYNSLHDSGFVSIGCAPCTRPIGEGEDSRAGRWWWETQSSRECGLHLTPEKAS